MAIYLDNTAGENARRRKLNAKQVYEIRQLYDKGKRGAKLDCQKRWGISPRTFDDVGARRTWKSLADKK